MKRIQDYQTKRILKTLEATNNKSAAARSADVHRCTVYRVLSRVQESARPVIESQDEKKN
jgi:ActR/RegA family two-component response regulator